MNTCLFETREDTARSLLDIIRPLKQCLSPGSAFLAAGSTGVHYGSRDGGMEGFARILWGLGPLLSRISLYKDEALLREAGEWREIVKSGLIHGTDPEDREYWGEIRDNDQKIVESAAIVVFLTLNQDLWRELKERERGNLYQWLNQMNSHEMPKNNWRFFRILTNMTFTLLGLPCCEEKVREDRELIERSYLGEGWYYDGGKDKLDYYIGFAFHFYGLLYASFMKDRDPEYGQVLKERAELFAKDYIYFFSNDGTSIPFGRSLTYRFAHVSFFGAYALAGGSGMDYGVLRDLFIKHMEHWMGEPVFDKGGILSVGYSYPNLIMSEHYNSSGSPYWALKAFMVLALPEGHEFWKAGRKEFVYEKSRCLKKPRMIITHDGHGTVMAYPAGQHCPGNHGHVSEKYEKFVYSNRFGFSISRGTELNDGAFDNTIAFSHAGENRYAMRKGCDSYEVQEAFLRMAYRPINGVRAESIIIPCSPWHVRIHLIDCESAVDVSDGGFSVRAENRRFDGKPDTGVKYRENQVRCVENRAEILFPWGKSAVLSLSGGIPEVIQCFPNTNILYGLTVMPLIRHHLEKGRHMLVSCVFGDCKEMGEYQDEEQPKVTVKEDVITVLYKEGQTTVRI